MAARRPRRGGDVEPERLLLELQQLVLVELVSRRHRGMVPRRCVARRLAEIDDRALPHQLVGLLLLPPPDRRLQTVQHPAPRRAPAAPPPAPASRLHPTPIP